MTDMDRTTANDAMHRQGGAARLVRLADMDDYEVADGEPDVRGWSVASATGQELGKVESLFVDPAALKVRYLEVQVKQEATGTDGDSYMLIPIGLARLDDDRDVVRLDRLSSSGLRGAPVYDRGAISEQDEQALRAHYRSAFGTDASASYDDDMYDHRRFYGARWSGRDSAL